MENILKKYWKGKEIIKYNYSSLKNLVFQSRMQICFPSAGCQREQPLI